MLPRLTSAACALSLAFCGSLVTATHRVGAGPVRPAAPARGPSIA